MKVTLSQDATSIVEKRTHANNLKNVILPSAENIEEMVMKDKEDAEMDLNRLGVAVAE